MILALDVPNIKSVIVEVPARDTINGVYPAPRVIL
jgi:hypothetical protein